LIFAPKPSFQAGSGQTLLGAISLPFITDRTFCQGAIGSQETYQESILEKLTVDVAEQGFDGKFVALDHDAEAGHPLAVQMRNVPELHKEALRLNQLLHLK